VTFFCISIIGQGVWIFVLSSEDDFNSHLITRWMILVIFIFVILTMITVDTLLCFHLYLVFGIKKSTLEYIMGSSNSQSDTAHEVRVNE